MNSDLTLLISEYSSLGSTSANPNWELIEAKLIDEHDWTPKGAEAVVSLAREYGFSVLRNAAALAFACDFEDGELGL